MSLRKFLKQALCPDPYGYDDPGNDPMSCPAISVPSIDQAFYDKLLAQATAAGVKFNGDQAEIDGIVLDWQYDPATQVLTVSCLKKPFFISCGQIESRVRELIQQAKTEGV